VRALGQLGMWGLALVFGWALLVSLHIHLASFRGAELESITAWHWTLASTAFLGTLALSILFTMLGHEATADHYDSSAGGRYSSFDPSVIRWPGWVTLAVRVFGVYAAVAFTVFFLLAPESGPPAGRSAGPDGGAPAAAEHDAGALVAQRGLTSLYLPTFLALGATALFARPADS